MISVFDVTYHVGRISKFGYIHEYVLTTVLEFRDFYLLGYILAV